MARKSFRLAINPKSFKESGPVLSTEFLFYFVFDESAKKIVAFLWFVKNSLTFQVFCDLCCEIILSSECAGTDFFTFELPWIKFVGIRNRTHNLLIVNQLCLPPNHRFLLPNLLDLVQFQRKLRTSKKDSTSTQPTEQPQQRFEPIDYEEDLDFSLQVAPSVHSNEPDSPVKSSNPDPKVQTMEIN